MSFLDMTKCVNGAEHMTTNETRTFWKAREKADKVRNMALKSAARQLVYDEQHFGIYSDQAGRSFQKLVEVTGLFHVTDDKVEAFDSSPQAADARAQKE